MNYISVQSSRDVIKHYGTKGMKWGVRKTLKTVGRMAGNALRHPHLSEYALVAYERYQTKVNPYLE